MKEKIQQSKNNFESAISKCALKDKLEEIRVAFLGKKGEITLLMQGLRDVAADKKREVGIEINNLKTYVETQIDKLMAVFDKKEVDDKINSAKKIDFSLPIDLKVGSLHPRTITQKQVEDIFVSMGFSIEDGPEIVSEFENFDAVNVPVSHPARDAQDTFWLDNGQVLKTHTSASQNRILKKYGAPVRAIFPGRCFRNEDLDNNHENTFFQLEGMVVDKDVSVANLVFFVKELLSKLFGQSLEVRLRPGFFPFTEPSFEMDVECPFCHGKGCPSCKNSGWIELCPCGMIHPKVLEMGGVDPEIYSGFAFGLGLDRLVMISGNIPDIRLLNSGNIKFLKKYGLGGSNK